MRAELAKMNDRRVEFSLRGDSASRNRHDGSDLARTSGSESRIFVCY